MAAGIPLPCCESSAKLPPLAAITLALIIEAAAGQVRQLAPHGHQLYHHLLAGFCKVAQPLPLFGCLVARLPIEQLEAHNFTDEHCVTRQDLRVVL